MLRLALVIFVLGVASVANCVEISNGIPRRDVNGDLMDIHDGNIMQWKEGGLYYYYGMGYQNCSETRGLIPPVDCPGIYKPFGECGFREDHAVNLYTSSDLVTWRFVGNILPMASRPSGIYFRPKVIYNRKTAQYILWINYLPPASTPLVAYPNAVYLTATSSSPSGPFDLRGSRAANVTIGGGGDFTLLVDGDIAYLAYDAWANSHVVSVEMLTDSFTDSLGATATSGPVSPSGNEAPMLLRLGDWFYLFFGPTCCFCHQGSGASVYTAAHPLGPWESMDVDINPTRSGSRVIKAQNNDIFSVTSRNGTMTHIYTGDLWTSAPDQLKSHDLQYWQPLSFDSSSSPPTPYLLAWVDSFELDIY